MKWKRIVDEQPPDNVSVLLYVEGMMIEGFFEVKRTPTGRLKYYDYLFEGSNGCDCSVGYDNPTHWMTLPTKPEDE